MQDVVEVFVVVLPVVAVEVAGEEAVHVWGWVLWGCAEGA